MLAYITRRLLLIIPTLLGIMVINFAIVQLAPGGPIEQIIAELSGTDVGTTGRISSSGSEVMGKDGGNLVTSGQNTTTYRGAQGLDPEFIKELEKQFGFDKPLHERFIDMIGNYITFDFGTSFFRDETVVDLVFSKLPVSISLGLWTTIIVYLVSIPLGIRKAVRDGSRFDVWTTAVLTVGFAIPSFVIAILLIVLFSGGSFIDLFPLRGLISDDFEQLTFMGQMFDYLWHLVLPITALVLGGFLSLTMLTKNSFLDEINKQYVITARAKGITERRVLYKHVFRNAMLIIIAGFPAAFIGMFFTGSLLIEIIFSLDGLGLLGFESTIQRDYPVMFGTLFVFTLLGLIVGIISDLMYTVIDPRIDFETREA